MVNKKGYIKTLEAVIAIVLIMIFIFTFLQKAPESEGKTPPVVEASQKYILDEVVLNATLREKVINADLSNPGSASYQDANTTVAALIEANLPAGYTYTFLMCDQTTCVTAPPAADVPVYFDDVFIASFNTVKTPRLVRLWFWQKV